MEKEKTADNQIYYLQMIQNVISRMGTTSAVFKGFSATIITGIAIIPFHQQKCIVLLLSFAPVLLCAGMDAYYLKLERKMRYLYEKVRLREHRCDFDMDIQIKKEERKVARIRLCDLISSPSIWAYYLFVVVVLVTIIAMRMKGAI